MPDVVPAPIKKPRRYKSPRKQTLSLQQRRAIKGLTEALISRSDKTLEQVLVEAGYSLESARQQSNVMAGLRRHIDPIVTSMEGHREKVMALMDERIKEADYGQLTGALDKLTKNIRLLTGKSTQNLGVIVEERRAAIHRIIDN